MHTNVYLTTRVSSPPLLSRDDIVDRAHTVETLQHSSEVAIKGDIDNRIPSINHEQNQDSLILSRNFGSIQIQHINLVFGGRSEVEVGRAYIDRIFVSIHIDTV